jgi:hypothetical protein
MPALAPKFNGKEIATKQPGAFDEIRWLRYTAFSRGNSVTRSSLPGKPGYLHGLAFLFSRALAQNKDIELGFHNRKLLLRERQWNQAG